MENEGKSLHARWSVQGFFAVRDAFMLAVSVYMSKAVLEKNRGR